MITLILAGGLGNQMFQYAFARCLSLRRCDNLRMSLYYCRSGVSRPYALNNLFLSDDVKLMTKAQEFIAVSKFRIVNKLCKFFRKKNDFCSKNFLIQLDFPDEYEPGLMSQNFGDSLIVCGYFQTYKYFSDYEEKIKSELSVSTPPSEQNAAMIKELESCESVCVHVRRGDYLLDVNANLGNVCSYEYYDRAIKFMKEKLNSPMFYFFSNDHSEIEWLKANWNFPDANIKYVDLNNSDYEELRLMYSCKNFIIANSSFSWWGAYLSRNKNKIVCAPSKWLNEMQAIENNILPPDWNVISIE